MIESGKINVSIDSDLEAIVPDFLEHRRQDVGKLIQLLEAGDYQNIMSIGHGMKGSGGGYGFDKISEIGREMETFAKTKDGVRLRELTQQLSDFLDRVQIVYE